MLPGSVQTRFLPRGQGYCDSRRCTTHHSLTKELARLAPSALVEENRIFVEDGPVLTSDGIMAGVDLALYLVADIAGDRLAMDVAREMEVYLRRSGEDAQLSPGSHTATISILPCTGLRISSRMILLATVRGFARRPGSCQPASPDVAFSRSGRHQYCHLSAGAAGGFGEERASGRADCGQCGADRRLRIRTKPAQIMAPFRRRNAGRHAQPRLKLGAFRRYLILGGSIGASPGIPPPGSLPSPGSCRLSNCCCTAVGARSVFDDL